MSKHIRNAKHCPACCCGGYYTHGNGCGGRLHERLVDDTIDDGYIHNYKCDKCDLYMPQIGYEDEVIEFA